jgi:hypothetical protein
MPRVASCALHVPSEAELAAMKRRRGSKTFAEYPFESEAARARRQFRVLTHGRSASTEQSGQRGLLRGCRSRLAVGRGIRFHRRGHRVSGSASGCLRRELRGCPRTLCDSRRGVLTRPAHQRTYPSVQRTGRRGTIVNRSVAVVCRRSTYPTTHTGRNKRVLSAHPRNLRCASRREDAAVLAIDLDHRYHGCASPSDVRGAGVQRDADSRGRPSRRRLRQRGHPHTLPRAACSRVLGKE